MAVAEAELARGVREIPGPQHEARILAYHQATAFRATSDEVPWCASFVSWCLREAGVASTNSAAARSYLQWGQALDDPRYGAITVLARGKSPAMGHVGFYVGAREDAVLLLGGNQGNAVSIAAFPRERVLAYRWPDRG
jgi:uncharacterized protein (TIGR02594 family)